MTRGKTSEIFAKLKTRILLCAAIAALLPGMHRDLPDFESRILARHNIERVAMGVPPLKWDAALSRRAQAWADHLAATNKFEHSPDLPGQGLEGENIWGGTSGAYSPEKMVNLWIAEKNHFVKGVFPDNSSTGRVQDVSHYTQLVWRGTRAVGCGISRGRTEDIMVCRYSEPGNLHGTDPLLS